MSLGRLKRELPALAGLLFAAAGWAQTVNNQSISGKYYFRHILLGTDVSGNLTDARSLLGAITFDGSGHYNFTGQLVLGAGAASSQTGSGTYSVDPAGFVSLSSPIRTGDTVNARFGAEAVIGSSTESTSSAFDMFVAIPAPTTATSLSTLNGSYWAATLEFPGASFANARNTMFNVVSSGTGALAGPGPAGSPILVSGHAANLSAGQPNTVPVTGATYTMATDGTATVSLGTASLSSLLSGTKTVYVSKDGNILLGGSTANGSHDILIAVKAISGASNTSWTASAGYWGAGLRRDNTGITAFAGSEINGGTGTSGGPGTLIWSRRLKVLGVGNVDFTGVNSYSVNANGSGTAELTQAAVGGGTTTTCAVAGATCATAFLTSSINPNDPAGYEIDFGVQMAAVSGTGLWINPQGIINPTSFSPTGSPIAPGDFIRVYGSGLPQTVQQAKPPYPPTLNGVTVLVNGQPVPIYETIPGAVDFLIPYGTSGPTATVAVQAGGATSNTVTVAVAATAPGILTLCTCGSGPGAILHNDGKGTVVSATAPAVGGEVISVYLTGLGTVTPAISDGAGGGANPPSTTNAQPTVLIGGVPATVQFSGMTIYPGLYQINVTVPPVPPGVTSLPLAIGTANAFHDQVDLIVQP
ncbi:MAG TPA: hypothetical protein VKT49_22185 [Bryobacteraceae bacterium]|nr:hypothetical protein [Bryobacteraceae bacterium]